MSGFTLRCPQCGHAYGSTETAMLGVFERDDELAVAELALKLGCSRPVASNTAKRLCLKGVLYRFPQVLAKGGKRYVYTIYHRGAEARGGDGDTDA